MSISNYFETVLLGQLPSPVFVKLHTGDPGEAGTDNAFITDTRDSVTLAAASGNTRATSAAAEWLNLTATGTQTITHVSIWDNISAGNCLWSGPVSPTRAVVTGDDLTIASGDLIFDLD